MLSEKFKLLRKTSNRYFDTNKKSDYILLTFNDNYVVQAINLMMSIIKFNKNISFICLCDELSKDRRNELFSAFQSPVAILLYEYKMMFSFPSIRWATTALYRVFSPFLIDEPVEKVLYLDADMLCKGSLDAVFDMKDYCVCMASEISANTICKSRRIGIKKELGDALIYCNSGFTMLNFVCIKDKYTFEMIFNAFFDRIDDLKYPDQDFLNWYFRDVMTYINGFIYDFQPYELKGNRHYYKQALDNALIIHFTSGKPWDRDCDPWLMRIYLKYSVYEKMIRTVKHEMKRSIQLTPIKLIKRALKR